MDFIKIVWELKWGLSKVESNCNCKDFFSSDFKKKESALYTLQESWEESTLFTHTLFLTFLHIHLIHALSWLFRGHVLPHCLHFSEKHKQLESLGKESKLRKGVLRARVPGTHSSRIQIQESRFQNVRQCLLTPLLTLFFSTLMVFTLQKSNFQVLLNQIDSPFFLIHAMFHTGKNTLISWLKVSLFRLLVNKQRKGKNDDCFRSQKDMKVCSNQTSSDQVFWLSPDFQTQEHKSSSSGHQCYNPPVYVLLI